jgi:aldehyde dehydrogenase family 7 protein A1
MADADLSLAIPATFFGAVGTTGQRCTSTRRLYLHRKIAPEFLSRLQEMYSTIRVGDPLDQTTLLGPLHTPAAINVYSSTVQYLRRTGAEILCGGKRYQEAPLDAGNFVQPTIAVPKFMDPADPVWNTETFAPILNVAVFDELDQAIEWNNSVPQGLSSSLWTRDLRNVGKWIGPAGADTGIVNVGVHRSSLG